jgi:hypothetical protein
VRDLAPDGLRGHPRIEVRFDHFHIDGRIEAQAARQRPVHVHARVPVVASPEDRKQFTRRAHVGCITHHV